MTTLRKHNQMKISERNCLASWGLFCCRATEDYSATSQALLIVIVKAILYIYRKFGGNSVSFTTLFLSLLSHSRVSLRIFGALTNDFAAPCATGKSPAVQETFTSPSSSLHYRKFVPTHATLTKTGAVACCSAIPPNRDGLGGKWPWKMIPTSLVHVQPWHLMEEEDLYPILHSASQSGL